MSVDLPRVLVAEDDAVAGRILELALARAGFLVERATNGESALAKLVASPFDALVTDWMMPEMDGIELCRRVRAVVPDSPAVVMITALASPESRMAALASGADDFLAKPAEPAFVVKAVNAAVARRNQPSPTSSAPPLETSRRENVPFVALGITASTGGPEALGTLFSQLAASEETCIFVVQHGPSWMVEDLVAQLRQQCAWPVNLAIDAQQAESGRVFVAAAGRHIQLDPQSFRIRLLDTPPENYVKPAADPLFRSLAVACGRFAVATVLTGLGRDGALGAAAVANQGGLVFVQTPGTCLAPNMPQTIVDIGRAHAALPLNELAQHVNAETRRLARDLRETTGLIRSVVALT